MPRASDVTSRDAVLAAMAEFDQMGREAFLAKYGFGSSREYVVVENGRQYDSKALLGAAYSHQFDGRARLRSADFSGGDETRRVLERLGFQVRSIADDEPESAEPPALGLQDGIEQILGEYGQARSGQFGSTAPVLGDLRKPDRSVQHIARGRVAADPLCTLVRGTGQLGKYSVDRFPRRP